MNLREYSDAEPMYGSWSRGFRRREEIEVQIERVLDNVGFLRGQNYAFHDYSVPLAHACGRWLGTHRQIFEAMDGFRTPGELEGDLSPACRLLPDAWFEKFESSVSRMAWRKKRPLYFGLAP